MVRNSPNELKVMVPIIDALAEMFGEENFEFTIHDFRNPSRSLVYIRGNITNREIGAPLTNRLLNTYRKDKDKAEDIVNLKTRTTTGLLINTSTIFIRNSQGRIIGSFGIIINSSSFQQAADVIQRFVFGTLNNGSENGINFATNVHDSLNQIIDSTIVNKPAERLNKEEKIEIVRQLEEKGVFLVKGSIEEIARRFNVSRYTIYNYLEELRKDFPRR